MLRFVHQNIKCHECELIFSIFSRVKKVFFSCSSKSSPTPTPLDNSWSRQRPRPIRFGSLLFTSFYHLQHIHMHAISQAKGEFKQKSQSAAATAESCSSMFIAKILQLYEMLWKSRWRLAELLSC